MIEMGEPIRGSFFSGMIGGKIVVDAAAGFAAQTAFLDVLAEQRVGAVLLAESLVEIFKDFEADVETDEIDHFERAHGVVQAEFDGFINVGCGGDTSFEQGKSFVADEGVYARSDETGSLLDNDGFLVHAVSD